MRVVGYVRVSTEEQAASGLSLESQEKKVRGYCDLYELDLVEILNDGGESAKSLDRPGARRALALLRERKGPDGLVVAKLDRLTRSLRDWQGLVDEFFGEKGAKRLYSVGESIDTSTASGRLALNLLMTIAQWEREAIGERTRDGLAAKIARRELAGGVPYGADIVGERADYAPGAPVPLQANGHELHALGLMRAWRGQGKSYREMAALLEGAGVRTKKGERAWQATTIKRILDRDERQRPT